MISLRSKLASILFVLALAAALLAGNMGLSHFGMSTDADGNMTTSNCPFMFGQTAICTMSPLEHIAAWQSMFASLPAGAISILGVLLLAAFIYRFNWAKLQFYASKASFRARRFALHHTYILSSTSLQELFSNGILNPKVF